MRCLALPFTLVLALAGPAAAQSSAEMALARAVLTQINPISIQANREYCGYLGYDARGRLVASPAARGRRDSCEADPGDLDIVASYHTHGAFHPDAESETPSFDDLFNDMDEGVDGYIATPGGRFWYNDSRRGVARMICGLNCLPADPRFRAGTWGRINKTYTLDALEALED
jgi:hypothetical protein